MHLSIEWKFVMRRAHIVAVAVTATAIASGGVALAAVDSNDKARLASPPGAAALASPARPEDPNKKAEKEFFLRYNAWLDSPVAQNLDLRSLPRDFLMADFLPSEASLDAATARADLIVLGEAVDYKFGSWGSSVTLKVEAVLKGQMATTVTVSLPGGPQPDNADFTKATLVEGEAAPILLPGDRALLFLQRSPDGKRLSVQPYSGYYRVDPSGKVHPLTGNTFGGGLDGTDIAQFTVAVAQRVR